MIANNIICSDGEHYIKTKGIVKLCNLNTGENQLVIKNLSTLENLKKDCDIHSIKSIFVESLYIKTNEVTSFSVFDNIPILVGNIYLYNKFDFSNINKFLFLGRFTNIFINNCSSIKDNYINLPSTSLSPVNRRVVNLINCRFEDLDGLRDMYLDILYIQSNKNLKSLYGFPIKNKQLLTVSIFDCPLLESTWKEWLNINYDIKYIYL